MAQRASNLHFYSGPDSSYNLPNRPYRPDSTLGRGQFFDRLPTSAALPLSLNDKRAISPRRHSPNYLRSVRLLLPARPFPDTDDLDDVIPFSAPFAYYAHLNISLYLATAHWPVEVNVHWPVSLSRHSTSASYHVRKDDDGTTHWCR